MIHTRYSAYPSRSLVSTEAPRQDSNLRIFTGQRSHVGTVTDNMQVPVIRKRGSAVITFVQGNEVNAIPADNKTYETLIPLIRDESRGRWRDSVDGSHGPLQNYT